MLKRSGKILLEGTLDEFKNYPRGAEGREYVLMNIKEKKPDGSYAFYEKDEKGDIIPVSFTGTEGYDATLFEYILFVDPEFESVILLNFDTSNNGKLTTEEADAITDIGQIFENNTALVTIEDLELLQKVKKIGLNAFSGCTSLTSANIPTYITEIGSGAFKDCTSLTSITCKRITPPSIADSTFDSTTQSSCTLYVPINSLEAYLTADYWEDFLNIVGFESEA